MKAAICVALASALVVAPALGQAQAEPDSSSTASSAPDVAEARAAFEEGTKLAKEERWAAALEAFERSEALHPHPVTSYNIGYCELVLGHPTLARKMLGEALVGMSLCLLI